MWRAELSERGAGTGLTLPEGEKEVEGGKREDPERKSSNSDSPERDGTPEGESLPEAINAAMKAVHPRRTAEQRKRSHARLMKTVQDGRSLKARRRLFGTDGNASEGESSDEWGGGR